MIYFLRNNAKGRKKETFSVVSARMSKMFVVGL